MIVSGYGRTVYCICSLISSWNLRFSWLIFLSFLSGKFDCLCQNLGRDDCLNIHFDLLHLVALWIPWVLAELSVSLLMDRMDWFSWSYCVLSLFIFLSHIRRHLMATLFLLVVLRRFSYLSHGQWTCLGPILLLCHRSRPGPLALLNPHGIVVMIHFSVAFGRWIYVFRRQLFA